MSSAPNETAPNETAPKDTRAQRLASRIAHLDAHDRQFAAAKPDHTVTVAAAQPDLRLPQILRTIMAGYADRPALGARAVELIEDPATGRTTPHLLPRFTTVTYRELWERARAVASALGDVRPGDRVAVLGFSSVDYTTLDLALLSINAVEVPLQTSAPIEQLRPIVAETEPVVIATSADYLSDAVELAQRECPPARLVVFDYEPAVDDQREAYESARARLAGKVVVETLADVIARGKTARTVPTGPAASAADDQLALLMYTSGSTGAPKGAMYTEQMVAGSWRPSAWFDADGSAAEPVITLNFMPMSHVVGRSVLYGTLSKGGTAYFAARSDLSTLLDDLALVRPTRITFVPRIWEMLFHEFQGELDLRAIEGADRATLATQVLEHMREHLLGGRFISVMSGSAPMSAEMRAWVESLVDMAVVDGYGSTEAGSVFLDGQILRPAVLDYKLVDVPELNYFRTDRPHPRGELLVKTALMFPGYYKRPELTTEVFDADGFYRTGDIVAEVGVDQVEYLDRRNYVLKLAQGEFVAVSKLEAAYGTSPLVRQIYVYGNSARSYLLAVVVPTVEALATHDEQPLKAEIIASLQEVAAQAGLQSYEVPRDVIVETTPFTLENGLLTGVRKLARPKLKQRYGPAIESRYAELADGQADELSSLRRDGAALPVLEAVLRAVGALLGASAIDLTPSARFTDLGGDSLSALTFANLLRDIFGVDVPVGVIVSPATDLQGLADYLEGQQRPGPGRRTFASVHGADADEVSAADLRLDRFVDAETLAGARSVTAPEPYMRTVLLTGATGFLGRFLALEWLERLAFVDGKLICLVRGKDDRDARARLDRTFDSGDPQLLAHYRALAEKHLEVIAGDKSEANLGLDQPTWQRLADTVDLIIDPAAMVNHVLPYRELFGPNVVGTAELIRLALTTKLKPFAYVSTVGVGDQIAPADFVEDADIRMISPVRAIDDSYANGYGNSKWAGEVLLREAHDQFGLPVAVFRCDMIMVDTRYIGQLNVPDMFTRLMLSLAATGIAPYSFYKLGADGARPRAHYDGLPVDFVAEAISTLSERVSGFETYHVMNPHDDGVGLDAFVDWLDDAGCPVERIGDYDEWFARFGTAMRALPDRQRQHSLLPLLHSFWRPSTPLQGSLAPADRFRAAVQEAKIGPDKDIPHLSASMIDKYVTNLRVLGLL